MGAVTRRTEGDLNESSRRNYRMGNEPRMRWPELCIIIANMPSRVDAIDWLEEHENGEGQGIELTEAELMHLGSLLDTLRAHPKPYGAYWT